MKTKTFFQGLVAVQEISQSSFFPPKRIWRAGKGKTYTGTVLSVSYMEEHSRKVANTLKNRTFMNVIFFVFIHFEQYEHGQKKHFS